MKQQSQLFRSIQTATRTLSYVVQVQSVAPPVALADPSSSSGSSADAFAITTTSSTTSLHDYHTAFLFSPVFQLELWILKTFGGISSESVSDERLHQVGTAQHDRFAFWTTVQRRDDGDDETAMVVMRCCTPTPFCDTFWGLRRREEDHTVVLLFGTAMLGGFSNSWIVWALDPLHNLYSRILLASAKETLERRQHDEDRQHQ